MKQIEDCGGREKFPNSQKEQVAKRTFSVLCFTGFYPPGFKGGGPIRTIYNLVQKVSGEINFSVVTLDRDLGDKDSYPAESMDQVRRSTGAKVFYISPKSFWIFRVWKIINEFEGDLIYLNSFFSVRFSIIPFFIWLLNKPGRSVIVGPRGEFSTEALSFKSFKKKLYINFVKTLGFYRHVIWQASAAHDAEDIRRVFGENASIRIAVNIACPPPVLDLSPRKKDAPLRVVFVSRISPMKNLRGAIQMLKRVKIPLVFDVYGPIEDKAYWADCLDVVEELPINIVFNYSGMLYPVRLPEVLATYDLFYLPTLGENFGHVIAEALGCGLPVLISTSTPWRNLKEKKLGWDIPLDQPEHFATCIEECNSISGGDYDIWRKNIRSWALENIGSEEAVEQSRKLFSDLELSNEF
ncbi:MAG: glycosyl transferase, group 1 [Proteobacteria bacterium]|nr:glycosyl transferase, group 1 [Pseudomonadota bacterium]